MFFYPEAGYQVNLLARYEVFEGHEVYIVTSPMEFWEDHRKEFWGDSQIENRDKRFEEETGAKILRFPVKRIISSRMLYKKGYRETISRLNPDILFLHSESSISTMRYLLTYNKNEFPIIIDSHMLEMASRNRFRKFFYLFYRQIFARIIKNNRIVVIRTQDDDFISKKLGVPLKQAPFISFGSDLATFHPDYNIKLEMREKLRISKDAFITIVTGKLTNSKGGLLLAAAFRNKFDTEREMVIITIGTPTNDEYGQKVTELLSSSLNKVIRIPTQKYYDLAKYYQCSDISVFARECSLSFYDAQACGLPVVVEDNNINKSRVSYQNGKIFDSGNVEELRRAILYFANLPKEDFMQYSKNAVKLIRDCYDYKAISEEYSEVMKDAIKDFKCSYHRMKKMKISKKLSVIPLYYIDLLFCLTSIFVSSMMISLLLRIIAFVVAVVVVGAFIYINKTIIPTILVKRLFIPFIVLVGFLLTIIKYGPNSMANSTMMSFISYSIPMILLAWIYVKKNILVKFDSAIDFVLLLFLIYFIFILTKGLFLHLTIMQLSDDTNIGYQSTSYYGSYAFGLALYALLFNKTDKINLFQRIVSIIIRITSLAFGFLVQIYGSGNGAFVLTVIYTFVIIAMYLNGPKNIFKFLVVIIFLGIIIVFITNLIAEVPTLSQSFDRILRIFKAGEINYESTSGRTLIYKESIKKILESPLIGYGISSAPYIGIGQPHQMFLEILIDGGIIYLFIWLYELLSSSKKLIWLIKYDTSHRSEYVLIIVVFLSQFVMIQFSGFYLRTYSFWFSLAYIAFKYDFVKRSIKKKYGDYNEICRNDYLS